MIKRIKTQDYIEVYTQDKYKLTFKEFISLVIQRSNIKKKKKNINELAQITYDELFMYCSDLFLIDNQIEDIAKYERFDNMLQKIITNELYHQCNIEINNKDNDKYAERELKNISKIEEEIEYFE